MSNRIFTAASIDGRSVLAEILLRQKGESDNEIIVADLQDEGKIPDLAGMIVLSLLNRKAADRRVRISRKASCELQGIGPTRHQELEKQGELPSTLDGGLRFFDVASIYNRLIVRAIESYSAEGVALKTLRGTRRTADQRSIRTRTRAELEGLRIGNAKRAAEAKARREAKAARAASP